MTVNHPLMLRHATKKYGSFVVFENLNLSIERGGVTVIYGPSGCGKTTLLMCLALLEPLTSGQVLLDGTILTDGGAFLNEKVCREKIGIVFQDFYLWDNKLVLNNLTEALIHVRGVSPVEAENKSRALAGVLKISDDLLLQYPPQLSRGQRQRIAIARTLLMEPEIVLLDEASASLDEGLVKQLTEIIQVLKAQGKTVLAITHDRHFASVIGDKVLAFSQLLANKE